MALGSTPSTQRNHGQKDNGSNTRNRGGCDQERNAGSWNHGSSSGLGSWTLGGVRRSGWKNNQSNQGGQSGWQDYSNKQKGRGAGSGGYQEKNDWDNGW